MKATNAQGKVDGFTGTPKLRRAFGGDAEAAMEMDVEERAILGNIAEYCICAGMDISAPQSQKLIDCVMTDPNPLTFSQELSSTAKNADPHFLDIFERHAITGASEQNRLRQTFFIKRGHTKVLDVLRTFRDQKDLLQARIIKSILASANPSTPAPTPPGS